MVVAATITGAVGANGVGNLLAAGNFGPSRGRVTSSIFSAMQESDALDLAMQLDQGVAYAEEMDSGAESVVAPSSSPDSSVDRSAFVRVLREQRMGSSHMGILHLTDMVQRNVMRPVTVDLSSCEGVPGIRAFLPQGLARAVNQGFLDPDDVIVLSGAAFAAIKANEEEQSPHMREKKDSARNIKSDLFAFGAFAAMSGITLLSGVVANLQEHLSGLGSCALGLAAGGYGVYKFLEVLDRRRGNDYTMEHILQSLHYLWELRMSYEALHRELIITRPVF